MKTVVNQLLGEIEESLEGKKIARFERFNVPNQ